MVIYDRLEDLQLLGLSSDYDRILVNLILLPLLECILLRL